MNGIDPFTHILQSLSDTHKHIAALYIRMSNTCDTHVFDAIQQAINEELNVAVELRVQLEIAKKQKLEDWKVGIKDVIHSGDEGK